MDFTVNNLAYDANGNILTMNQMGKNGATAPALIDQLSYTYRSNSNKLAKVADPINTAAAKLGDFNNGVNTTDDYDYDANGNLIKDENKKISLIRYNYLNLPDRIVLTGKGNIVYKYDASRNKVRKIVTDVTGGAPKVTTTDYIGNFVYRNDTLQFASHEEGRIRAVLKAGQPISYWYDYFLKDHLGNVRVVLTDQPDLSVYTATMEAASASKESALFSNIDNTRAAKPVGYPSDQDTAKNESVAKLTALNDGKRIGPSLVLRVYKSIVPVDKKEDIPLAENMLADLVQAFAGNTQSEGAHGVSEPGSITPFNSDFYNTDYQRLKEKDADQPKSDRPKAYLNFVLFDDQFKLVDENSGVRQVKAEPDQLQVLGQDEMVVSKSGFLYVYTSNESPQDVFFDDVAVALAAGPLLEESHYYPFGLMMAGISSNALKGSSYPENNRKYNGNELQSREFSDGSGLELYDFNARTYDQQIGRFLQLDPLIEKNQEDLMPYHFAFNNPPRYGDPDGKFPIVLIPIAIEIGEAIWLGYHATVNSAVNLLSEGVGKNGARPKEKEISPAVKDETAIPGKSPSKTIDESKPSISEEELNAAVFTTTFVIRNGEPILNVFHHKDDGAWEFTGATQAADDKDYLVISLQKIINLDSSILELADLPLGEAAYRTSQDAPWERYVL